MSRQQVGTGIYFSGFEVIPKREGRVRVFGCSLRGTLGSTTLVENRDFSALGFTKESVESYLKHELTVRFNRGEK